MKKEKIYDAIMDGIGKALSESVIYDNGVTKSTDEDYMNFRRSCIKLIKHDFVDEQSFQAELVNLANKLNKCLGYVKDPALCDDLQLLCYQIIATNAEDSLLVKKLYHEISKQVIVGMGLNIEVEKFKEF